MEVLRSFDLDYSGISIVTLSILCKNNMYGVNPNSVTVRGVSTNRS